MTSTNATAFSTDRPRPLAPANAPPRAAAAVSIDVFSTIAEAGADWQRLAAADAIATPFGGMGFVEAWHRHVGSASGVTPAVVVGRDDGAVPMFMLPLCVRRQHGARVAEFFGDSHSSINLGVWRRDAIDACTAAQMHDTLARAAALAGIDLFILRYLPQRWGGHANPLLSLPHQRGANDVYRLDIDGRNGDDVIKSCISSATRGTLRSKERKLAALDGYRYFRAATQAEADRILDAFFAQKAARLTANGIANVFAEPGVESFLRETCHSGLADGRPLMELHALEGDGEILAMIGGLSDGARFTTMINSYTLSEHGRWSPGLIIISHAIRHYADQGFEVFDLGMGYAPYKHFFCKDIDELYDSVVPITARGHAAAFIERGLLAAKRWIKTTPTVWRVVQKLRKVAA